MRRSICSSFFFRGEAPSRKLFIIVIRKRRGRNADATVRSAITASAGPIPPHRKEPHHITTRDPAIRLLLMLLPWNSRRSSPNSSPSRERRRSSVSLKREKPSSCCCCIQSNCRRNNKRKRHDTLPTPLPSFFGGSILS